MEKGFLTSVCHFNSYKSSFVGDNKVFIIAWSITRDRMFYSKFVICTMRHHITTILVNQPNPGLTCLVYAVLFKFTPTYNTQADPGWSIIQAICAHAWQGVLQNNTFCHTCNFGMFRIYISLHVVTNSLQQYYQLESQHINLIPFWLVKYIARSLISIVGWFDDLRPNYLWLIW